MHTTRRTMLIGAGCALLSASVLADTLTVTSWGGAYSMSQRKAYHEPFMKETGHTVLEDEWQGELGTIRAQVETGTYKWDVIDVETSTALAGCDEGILEPIPPEAIGMSEDDFIDGGALECAIGTISWATVLSYRTDELGNDPPETWADFWDVKKYPGKRALTKNGAYHNLEIALMADGVPPAEVYTTLKAPGGVDRAFAKMDEIKAHLLWWASGAQAPQLLADREVVMTSAWNGRIYQAVVDEGQPFAISWWGQLYDFDYFVVPKGNPKKDLAFQFIAFASRPDRQGDQTNYISYGNTVKGTDKFINPDILPHLPTAPANLAHAVRTDAEYWAENIEELRARFETWLAK